MRRQLATYGGQVGPGGPMGGPPGLAPGGPPGVGPGGGGPPGRRRLDAGGGMAPPASPGPGLPSPMPPPTPPEPAMGQDPNAAVNPGNTDSYMGAQPGAGGMGMIHPEIADLLKMLTQGQGR